MSIAPSAPRRRKISAPQRSPFEALPDSEGVDALMSAEYAQDVDAVMKQYGNETREKTKRLMYHERRASNADWLQMS